MTMTRYFNMILPLFVGALLFLPSVALASFPDFGPFEQQTRYLEAGFGIAENFFKEASGQGGTKTLQYLCLTAALVGAAMVIFRKKNQAMGVLIPWVVLVFIMLAGPFGSKLAFVKANSDISGIYTLPAGLESPDQKGFTPQVLSIHVMSTLHRLFYDYFDGYLDNVVSGLAAFQKMSDLDSFRINPATFSEYQTALNTCGQNLDPNAGGDTLAGTDSDVATGNISYSGDQLFKDLINYNVDPVVLPPIGMIPGTFAELPDGYDRYEYVNKLVEIEKNLAGHTSISRVSYDEDNASDPTLFTTAENVNLTSLVLNIDAGLRALDGYSSSDPSPVDPASFAFRIMPSSSIGGAINHPALTSREANGTYKDKDAYSDFGSGEHHAMYINMLSSLPLIKNEPTPKNSSGNATLVPGNGMSLEQNTVASCQQDIAKLEGDMLQTAGINAGIDSSILDRLKNNVPIDDALFNQVYPTANNSTKALLDFYQERILPLSGNDASEAMASFRQALIGEGVRNFVSNNPASVAGAISRQSAGQGSTALNGFVTGFAKIGFPVIQLISPFILAFSMLVIEVLKMFIDIALAGIIIVTPLVFMMGLLIPSNALGVMLLMTLSVAVLKMVPVTFTIVDGVLSIMHHVIKANLPTLGEQMARDGAISGVLGWALTKVGAPSIEEAFLLFAGAGMYMALVGLSLFILFKIGDPSSVAQLASLDNAAKSASKAALTAATALTSIAAVGAIGGGAAIKGQLGRKAAGKAAAGKLEGAQQRAAEEVEKLGEKASAMDKQKAFQESFAKEMGFTPGEEMFDETGAFKGMSAEEAFKEASGGLDMKDANKGLISNAALTALGEGGQVAAGAASSMLPGGGGALIQQATNANREGRARGEARVSARGEDKSLWQADYESDVQNYRQQYASKLGGSAAFDGEEGAGGSGMMSSMMMGNAMSDGKSQSGQMASGLWTGLEMGKRDEAGSLVGMSAADYQVAHSLQAREAAAQLKEASVSNANITSDQIQASAEAAALMTEAKYKGAGEQRDALNGLIRGQHFENTLSEERKNEAVSVTVDKEIDENTGEVTYKNSKVQGFGSKEFDNAFKEQVDTQDSITESFESKNANHSLKQEMDSIELDMQNAKKKFNEDLHFSGETNAEALATLKAQAATLQAQGTPEAQMALDNVNAQIKDIKANEAMAMEPHMDQWNARKVKFDNMVKGQVHNHMVDTAKSHAIRNMAYKDMALIDQGKNARFFRRKEDINAMSLGVDMSQANGKQMLNERLAEQRQFRYTAGTQYEANRAAAKQFFQADYDDKYKPKVKTGLNGMKVLKEADLSLARHYEYSMIHESADGASDLKMGSKVNRRMFDQDWDSYNNAKAMNLEAQLRVQAIQGKNTNHNQKMAVSINEAKMVAEQIEDRAMEVQLERTIVGVDPNSGKVQNLGQVVRQRATQDKYKKLNKELQKAMNNAGGAIAEFKGKDINGDSYVHDEPPGDLAAEIAKHFQRGGQELSKAYRSQAGVFSQVVQAGQRAKMAGVSKDKAIGKMEITDREGVTHHYTQVSLDAVREGFKLMGDKGKAAQKEWQDVVNDLKNNGFIEVEGKLLHKVGVTAKENMRGTKQAAQLMGKSQAELSQLSKDKKVNEQAMLQAHFRGEAHDDIMNFENRTNSST